MIAILLSVPVILVILTTSKGETGSYLSIAVKFHLMMVVPLVCLLNLASPIRDETEQGTLSYLATRPLPRSVFFLLLHGCHLLWLQIVFLAAGLLLLATGFWMEIPGIASMIAPFLVAQAGAALAFSGLSALAGILTRRYLVLGLLYGAIIEIGVGGIPTNINALSMSHHVRVIVSIFDPAADFLRTNEGNPAVSGIALIAVGATGALLAALIYRTREFTGGPDA
jgi:ABC-type transport system involved in multi-copper enzyme maturation permease subunit